MTLPKKQSSFKLFSGLLLQWNQAHNRRTMPWKGEKDPYKIWLSEIMLQQTRVEQGLVYYETFIAVYPTILQLAAAKDEAVFKLWEGLGYYSRCRNLLSTARYIAFELGGIFPHQYPQLLALKGVGPYTAAAIASFAFGLPKAVVDGNVYRVLSRYFGIELPIDTSIGKKHFNELAQQLLNVQDSATYNQAIMDFGAIVCKPALPSCTTCMLNNTCSAWASGRVNILPIKTKSIQRKKRHFYYFIFQHEGATAIIQRMQKDIWHSLHEFYLIESPKLIHWNNAEVKKWLSNQLGIIRYNLGKISVPQQQQLTHQLIRGQFIHIQLTKIPPSLKGFSWCTPAEIGQLAFPRFITAYLALNQPF